MHINEVIHIVGLSRKSIRYYESVGLLNPTRNINNDYREYNDDDIRKLKVIKFLRELGVPIRDLQLLNNGDITLKECIDDRINKINIQEDNFNKIKSMCIEISNSNDNYNDIDIDNYFSEMSKLNKEGFSMNDNKNEHSKKILGAIISSFIFSFMFLFFIIIISYFQFCDVEKIPWSLFIFIICMLLIPLIGIIINLYKRIIEINGGEEDEASKY